MKKNIRSILGGYFAKFFTKAMRSQIGKKLTEMIVFSPAYKSTVEKINKFRDERLEELVKSKPIPRHIAIIMDGNRRYARRLGLSVEEGHLLGRDKLQQVLDWCFELGINILTVYVFSTENFKRNEKEVRSLLDLYLQELKRAENDARIHKNKVRINIIGHLELLPEDIIDSSKKIMDLTKNYSDYILNVALAYGGRQEITDAVKKIVNAVKIGKIKISDIDEKLISSHLYTKNMPDPDLILRTSGEERISNFLLWQLAYSELYFSDVYWPAFRKRDFLKAIYTYQQRKRKFGK